MSDATKTLKGSATRLLLPTNLVSTIAGLSAGVYAASTVHIPSQTVTRFLAFIVVTILFLLVVASRRVSTALGMLKALERGHAATTPENLTRAVHEVRKFSDFVFWMDLQHWALAGLGISGIYKALVPEVTWGMATHILMVAAVFAPLSTVLSQPMTVMRCREVVERLAALGLSPLQLMEVAPAKRLHLRQRLLLFTAVTVIVPAIITADLSQQLAHSAQERMVAATKEDRAQVGAAVRHEALVKMSGLGLALLALAFLAAYGAGTMVGKPMQRVAEQAGLIEQGSLVGSGLVAAEDEVWAVSSAFARLHAHLVTVISQLRRAGMQIGSTTEQIVATSSKYEGGAAEQASSLNETSATTEELARSAKQIAENAAEVSELASKTLSASRDGQMSAQSFSFSVSRMREDNQAIAHSVVRLNKRVQQIGKIVTFINGVADKADLLALNAELEGTKAGEVGGGFALVAAEMRRLAENVLESTKEIELLIEEIRDATRDAVSATEAGVVATDGGLKQAISVTANLEEIATQAEHAFESVKAISMATAQQQAGTDQLADAMFDILRLTQTTLTASKQVASANVELSSIAKDLQVVVDRFRLTEDS
jgi:methyl-accepting chemotaxis protein